VRHGNDDAKLTFTIGIADSVARGKRPSTPTSRRVVRERESRPGAHPHKIAVAPCLNNRANSRAAWHGILPACWLAGLTLARSHVRAGGQTAHSSAFTRYVAVCQRHRHIPPPSLRVVSSLAWSLYDTCKTSRRARVPPAIPIQTLVLTTGPPVVPPSLRRSTTLHRTNTVPWHFLLAYLLVTAAGRSTSTSTQPRTPTPTPTRLLAASLARQPSLNPPYPPRASQVMHLVLAPSLCILAFIPSGRDLSIVYTTPQ